MKKLVLLAAVAGVVLSGCNTVRGMGQDVQNAGTAISSAAN